MLCRREGRVRLRLVAEMPAVDRVVGGDVVDHRGALALRRRGVDLGGQHLIIDANGFRRVLRLAERLGDDDRDMVADIAHLALRQRRMGAGLHRRAVLRMDHPAADEAANLVGRDVIAGQDGEDAGLALRLSAHRAI